LITLLLITYTAYSQQDVDFHINAHLFAGQKILKVKRDVRDTYVWVLAQNNGVYRINSQTMVVDDYTSKFVGYRNDKMIDIAGYNQDTACIVTKSKLITLFKGTAGLPGPGFTATGTINSIGVSNFHYTNSFFDGFVIGTETGGLYHYNFKNIHASVGSMGYARIYESTYRRLTMSDDEFLNLDTAKFNDLEITDDITFEVTNIWKGGQFGKRPNTAFYKTEGFSGVGFYANLFWGTDNGFFQIRDDFYQTEGANYYHYLPGIKVNKITDLFGLTSIVITDTAGNLFQKETLLAGTQNGLYFSNSALYYYKKKLLDSITLFHYDQLGHVPVNDICVNASATDIYGMAAGCENGVWVATNDGLYYLNPDYGKYIDPKDQLDAISFALPYSDTLSQVKICPGDSVSMIFNPAAIGINTIQWEKDGKDIVGQTGSKLAVKDSGDYYAILYTPCENIHIETNHLKVTLSSAPVFTFSYPNRIQQCNNNPDTLKTDNTPGYHYQWYSNGVLNGDTTSSFVVTQTGKYKVEVSACTNSWVPSKEVEVDLVNLPAPQITADKSIYCAEDTAALTVNVPADPGYTINWYRNGSLQANDHNLTAIKDNIAGSYTVVVNSNVANCTQTSAPFQLAFTPSPVFTFNYPNILQYCTGTPLTLTAVGSANYQYRWFKDGALTGDFTAALSVTQGGKYKVEVSACVGSWIASKEIQVKFITLPMPVITTDKPAYCIGDNATLSIAAPVDPSYTINWYRDNALIAANANQNTITTNVAGNYTVSIVNNTPNTDGTACSQTSAVSSLSFNPIPTVSIEKILNTTICEGQTIGLLAHYNGGTVKWSTGETTDQIGVITPGNYTATVTSAAGCQADASIAIAFLPNPVFSVKDTSICTYKKQPITLTAPPGFAQYAWNGTPGGQTYQVSQPQTVSLTVTDVNGCQASQQIIVADQCPNVYIPNAFTPNADGVNDTWVIEGLDNDPTVLVSVFTRYGTQIYESKGYGTPWNGEYKGKKMPAAVYYYIVTAKNGTQKFSGSLTIIY
ncbi:MAG: gliding motility-associated C-terminal domain-containing protein, partial [Sphingobacteriales bacterium]